MVKSLVDAVAHKLNRRGVVGLSHKSDLGEGVDAVDCSDLVVLGYLQSQVTRREKSLARIVIANDLVVLVVDPNLDLALELLSAHQILIYLVRSSPCFVGLNELQLESVGGEVLAIGSVIVLKSVGHQTLGRIEIIVNCSS